MKTRLTSLLLIIGIGMLTLLQGCGTAASEDESVVSGVVQGTNGAGIENAIVRITSPAELTDETVTNAEGLFSFSLSIPEAVDVTIQVNRTGYNSATETITVAPGVDVTDLTIELTSAGGGGQQEEETVGGEPEGAAAILLTGISSQAINIKETGDQVSSTFTFTVQDSAGRTLNLEKAVTVQFNIISGPGGGEEIIPDTARTNSEGEARSSLFSGNAAGPVKIEALVERDIDGDGTVDFTIRSKPVLIAIHGGFPDLNHFSIAADKYNFEGWSINGNRNPVTVIVGDKFSNPVKPGTVVYFSTTGGIIQGSAQTNNDGEASADLISGDPRPTDAITGSGGRPGYSTVTASTVDENDNVISKNINVVFSTTGALITGTCQTNCVDATTFDIPPNGGASFTYTVTDLNGNPMAAGTTITVSAGGDLEVTGDTDLTLGSYLFPGPGATDFNFSIRDTDEQSSDAAPATIKITVTPPSGNETTYSGLSGTRRKVAN